jgi:hypothetical protein
MHMIKFLTLCVASAILFAPNAYAKCAAGHKTIFSCTTAKGKLIEVCDAGKSIIYSFGSPQTTPEIALNVPRDKATTFQWAGVGSAISYAVDIPNDKTTYSVFFSMDRLNPEHASVAGVNVLSNGDVIATVKCSGKKMVNNLEGVDLAPTQ